MAQPFLLWVLAASLPLLIYFLGSLNYYFDYVQTQFQSDPTKELYEFIVVGGGSSGVVVAFRLSQYYKVLLLEAGGDPIALNNIPALAVELLGSAEFDWKYKTVPQKNAGFGIQNNQITSNKGKVLGGSSTLNYMVYVRGNPLDYDNWANITGDEGWKFENVLPFFKKSVKKYRGKFESNKKHHETSPYGFLTVETLDFAPMLDIFTRAAGELGYKNDSDVNGGEVTGFGGIEVTQNMGQRMSTYTAILPYLSNNKNLRIVRYAQVTKVKLDKNGNAVGVWYSHHGSRKLAVASKEIVLSAGSYDSPKLLMLSGIGPKKELEALGIKSRMDLPVGKNLQDHATIYLFPTSVNSSISVVLERDLGVGGFYEYLVKGKGQGILTSPSALSGQGFLTTTQAPKEFGREWPDIQILFFPVAPSQALKDALIKALFMKAHVVGDLMDPHDGKDGFIICPILVRPRSKGQVSLKDKNPFSDPIIDPQFLRDPRDLKAMVEAIKFGLRMIEETKAFQEVGAKLENSALSDCKDFKFRSDAYWECHIRHLLGTVWHPVGTCAMGKENDVSAVVDSKLRVFGVKGLRVIDASIMPVIVNGNTNAPTIMIGEKGADAILDHWAQQKLVCRRTEFFKILRLDQCHYAY